MEQDCGVMGIYTQKLTHTHIPFICMNFCLSKSFIQAVIQHLLKNLKEKNFSERQRQINLLHGAIQQWQRYRQDYLLENFETEFL